MKRKFRVIGEIMKPIPVSKLDEWLRGDQVSAVDALYVEFEDGLIGCIDISNPATPLPSFRSLVLYEHVRD